MSDNNGVSKDKIKENEKIQVPENIDPNKININDLIMDLYKLSKLCEGKIIEYSDLGGTFKQMMNLSSNMAVVLSTYAKEKGELDPGKFKLTQN